MNTEERNAFIATRLNEGVTLSDIQKELVAHGVNMTYLDLRMLAADLEVNWKKLDPKPVPKPAAEAALPVAAAGNARTQVTVSRVVRPGAAMSGDVTFASGAKGEWWVDSYGRPGLSLAKGSSKPTEEDVQEFSVELQRKLGGGDRP